ncbi:MAG TPA: SPOR domain-containing protein [Candidatus Acidoferrales bacterium]|jgi:cell division septation protein DedD|nr:SPOR domain-containing protein [Candidatus Acidoferrales bacterium]
MAGSGRRGGAERVLESRHLVGLFLGVVLLCGVFFTLGYVMGKTQYGGLVHAAEALSRTSPDRPSVKPKPAEPAPESAPANGEWDFYSKNNNNDRLQPAPKPSAEAAREDGDSPAPAKAVPPAAAKTVPASARFQAPRMSKSSVVLQVAALTHQSDALAMADALQQKRFPSFVVAPTSDNFYRVQVGPFADAKAAESAKNALDRAGFKAIIKR